MRIAALDVGSNSIHMVVAQVEPEGNFRVLDRAKEMVGLGRKSLEGGRLSAAVMERGLRTLAAFKTLAERQGATRFRAVATSAVREARNGGEFVQRIHDEVGLRVKVIPGREEARLIYLGVAQAVDLRGAPSLIVDVGGGSAELILVENGQPTAMHSLKLGVARLTDRFLRSDPPRSSELRKLDAHLAEELDPILETVAERGIGKVIATSGTMTALIAMATGRGGGRNGSMHNLEVPASDLIRLAKVLRSADREKRLGMRGIDVKRVDLIAAGSIVAARILAKVGVSSVIACLWALREGVIVDFIARHARNIEESARYADVRRRSVHRLLRRFGQSPAHSQHVARLALSLFDQLQDRLDLEERARELLEYAALLHDIGHLVDHHGHPLHSYYLIVHGQLLGFTRDEIEIVGQVAKHHGRRGTPKAGSADSYSLPRETWNVVRALAAILRLAEGLDRSHYAAVADVKVRARGGRTVIDLRTRGQDAALELWETRCRTDLMAHLLGTDLTVRVSRSAP